MGYNIKNFSDWKNNWATQNVQNTNKTNGGDFVSSETAVIFSGPNTYNPAVINSMVPIGFIQNMNVGQQKALQQIWEIGSSESSIIPGRTMVQGSIARILFDGPSLMYAMYIREKVEGDTNKVKLNPVPPEQWVPVTTATDKDKPTGDTAAGDITGLGGDNEAQLEINDEKNQNPGYFFINLASSFFNRATGLGIVLYDMNNKPYGGAYFQNCFITMHNFSIASQQTILIEQISFRTTGIVPIDLNLLS
jgi:hypothetical protein